MVTTEPLGASVPAEGSDRRPCRRRPRRRPPRGPRRSRSPPPAAWRSPPPACRLRRRVRGRWRPAGDQDGDDRAGVDPLAGGRVGADDPALVDRVRGLAPPWSRNPPGRAGWPPSPVSRPLHRVWRPAPGPTRQERHGRVPGHLGFGFGVLLQHPSDRGVVVGAVGHRHIREAGRFSSARAASTSSPTTSGTLTGAAPELTVIVTVEPSSAFSAAAGSCPRRPSPPRPCRWRPARP